MTSEGGRGVCSKADGRTDRLQESYSDRRRGSISRKLCGRHKWKPLMNSVNAMSEKKEDLDVLWWSKIRWVGCVSLCRIRITLTEADPPSSLVPMRSLRMSLSLSALAARAWCRTAASSQNLRKIMINL